MDPNQMPPQGMPMPPQEMPPMPPQEMAPSMTPEPEVSPAPQPLPEWNPPTNTGSKNDGHKKELLQKLMSNLLGKPGRSVNEIINGVKAAIGAYKNYAKEWDNLNGIAPGGTPGGSVPSAPSAGSSNSIQKIMQGIQAKKAPQDGSGGPGMTPRPMAQPQAPIVIPPSPQPTPPPLIAGQAQSSSFNRPAPVSNLGVWGF